MSRTLDTRRSSRHYKARARDEDWLHSRDRSLSRSPNRTDSHKMFDRAQDRYPGGPSVQMDAAPEQQDDGANDAYGNMGAPSKPIPLTRSNNQRQIEHMTLKFSGTTFIDPANGTQGDNTWSKFPWEFYALFLQGEQVQAINNTHLYWKAEHVHVQFKNPQCIQNLGGSTTGIVQSGTNTQAQMFGYLDNMYLNGIDQVPCEGSKALAAVPISTGLAELVNSWDTHGYVGGKPVRLPSENVQPSLFTSSTPDCKEMGMGGGQKFDFGWNIHNDYWRLTEELRANFADPILADPDTQGLWRWDPMQGYCVAQTKLGVAAAGNLPSSRMIYAASSGNHTQALPINVWAMSSTDVPAQATNNGSSIISGFADCYVRVINPDPIPGLYLQLQPQIGSLTGGLSESVCQLQWEMEVDIALTGRIPRQQTGQYKGNALAPALFSGRQKFWRVPVFRPAVPYLTTNPPSAMAAEEEEDDEM